MSNQKKFFSGNSIEQAVLQAARHFKLEVDELAYRRVERRHGFLKTRRRAVIEVDAENPRRQSEAVQQGDSMAVEEPTRETAVVDRERSGADIPIEEPPQAPPRQPRESEDAELTSLPDSLDSPERRYQKAEGEVAEAAREGLRRLLQLGGLDVEADVYQGEEALEIEIRGADEEAFLDDRGRLLLATQHLLPRVLRGLTGETVPCRVDCDNFQEIRTEQLRVLAQKVAAQVREKGRSRTLEPMSPDERRIIHVTLADDAAVETESQGSGLFKRVMVMPVRQKSRGFDPYN